MPTHTNALINESSPYLLQHAHNPVNWYPWGEEALEKAKKENKLIVVSVGYAACHWCHVMEHESFEDSTVAKFMNDNFVAIKVDREERPDIDQVYMNAIQLLTGRGGWPLNCIALPDGRPLYGGTYFPKESWLDMLSQVLNFVKENPERAEEQAKALTEGIRGSEIIQLASKETEFKKEDLLKLFSNWKPNIDYKEGGQDRAPKFPLPIGYQYLLNHYTLTRDKDALKAVEVTLYKMAHGGIYDQIGGGFARYSTDELWKVPHFEKMLYDNSQLVSLYAKAFQQTKNPLYQNVIEETLTFIERELADKNGGFYSSLDADSEGEEGKFYVWTNKEFDAVLGKDADLMAQYYEVTEKGNWEHGNNILLKTETPEKLMTQFGLTDSELSEKVKQANAKLLSTRALKIRPGLDDKILTSWNGLMLNAYVDAYRAFNEPAYLEKVLTNAKFILTKVKTKEGALNRNFKDGKSSINGFLDDYAFTISAFINLYEATFDEKWLIEANQLTEFALTHFWDDKTSMFYYTSNLDKALIARKMEIADNVIPASNSEMAHNLFKLSHYFYNDEYLSKATQMLANVKDNAIKNGVYYANWSLLMSRFVEEPFEVAIVGKDAIRLRKEFDNHYLPNVLFLGGEKEGEMELLKSKLIKNQTTIYVCQKKVCQYPVTSVKEALELMK
jgi:hypothetical protein